MELQTGKSYVVYLAQAGDGIELFCECNLEVDKTDEIKIKIGGFYVDKHGIIHEE